MNLRTDGISVRLLFERSARGATKRQQTPTASAPLRSLPTRGMYAIDQLKHLSHIEERLQVIGADPGKRELLVCADGDAQRGRDNFSVRYTAAQRRVETRDCVHKRERTARCPEALVTDLESLSSCNSRSAYLERQHAYFTRRRTFLPTALTYYEQHWHRRRHWERHIASQRSLTDFVRRIRSLRRDDNKTLAIAYGSWGAIAGRPGAACNRSLPPCLGCGLRRKLAAHFLIIPTPEAYTSKTCSLCGATCGPCETVDHQHREARTNAATTDVERQRAARFSVRGLRHCHNASCAAHLNRDRNAAVNIQRRCQTLLRNATLNVSVDDTDAEFEALRLWMCQGA